MKKALAALGAGLLVAGIVLVAVPLSTLFGAFTGWVVGWFFGATILGIFTQFGIHGVAMWQLGAFLGFIGGFLARPSTEGN